MKRPYLPDVSDTIAALKAIAKRAEDAGFLTVGQYFLMFAVPAEGGGELAVGGKLRYTAAKMLEDLRAFDGPATACFVVRYFDPEDAEDLALYEDHVRAALMERDSGEGKA